MKKLWVPLGVTCQTAQPIQPISSQIGLTWLCYLAGNSQTAPTIFFIFLAYALFIISWRTHEPRAHIFATIDGVMKHSVND